METMVDCQSEVSQFKIFKKSYTKRLEEKLA